MQEKEHLLHPKKHSGANSFNIITRPIPGHWKKEIKE